MTLAVWLAYVLAASALLGGAALLGEWVLAARRRATRGVWVAALAGSLLLPGWAVQRGLNGAPTPELRLALAAAREHHGPLPADRPPERAPEPLRKPLAAPAPASGEGGRILLWVLSGMTLGGLAWHALAHARLRWRRRGWREATLDGEPVLVARRFGPAIVGVLRPRIVVPEWALALPSQDRALLLLHEREHLRAWDAQLVWAARLVAALMPWNVPLAWQLARLRFAVEVDCDARVLHARPDARRYGTLLIEVTRRAIGAAEAVTAFSERRSALQRRLERMTPRPGERPMPRAVLAGLAALLLAGSAAAVPRPDRPLPLAPRPAQGSGGLPLGVADSVTTADGLPIAAARDLPSAFVVESFVSGADRAGARCAQYLLDPRDGTRLQLARTIDDAVRYERGDTVAVHHRSRGLYRVRQGAADHGLSGTSLLRVGCGDRVQITVRGQPFGVRVTTLDTPGDDRARVLAAAIARAARLDPDSVELRTGRVHVTFVGGALVDAPENVRFSRSHDIAALVWREYARAAGVDTVSIRIHGAWPARHLGTAFFYPDQLGR